MKFKKIKDERGLRGVEVKDGDSDKLLVQTRYDRKKGLYFETPSLGVMLTRAQALAVARAIIDELNPSQLA